MISHRIFCYTQHLSGVGHMIRTQQIAAVLARRHRVAIIDGGRPLPFPEDVIPVGVPRITRSCGELISLQPDLPLGQALALRSQRLREWLEANIADAILVEHFPFSKWELAAEIDKLLQTARRCNTSLKVICSLRDIAPRTRHEDPRNYATTVVRRLNQQFDAVLVHADPRLCSLEDYFPTAPDITIPIYHTGIVALSSAATGPAFPPGLPLVDGYVVASIGGGGDDAMLLDRVTRAWRKLKADGVLGSMALLLFGGLDCPQRGGHDKAQSIYNMGFDRHFQYWLQGARLSISCAGYNTCASLLVTGTPSLLVPNLRMSDQLERARLMEKHGAATYVPPPSGDEADPLPHLMLKYLGSRPAQHQINVDGAYNSARYIEELMQGLHAQ